MRDVVALTGRHRCTIHRWIACGQFPPKSVPSSRPYGWPRSAFDRWLHGGGCQSSSDGRPRSHEPEVKENDLADSTSVTQCPAGRNESVRISDPRYDRDRRRYDLALRMIRHQVRTRTISQWTGLSKYRIQTLFREYPDSLSQHRLAVSRRTSRDFLRSVRSIGVREFCLHVHRYANGERCNGSVLETAEGPWRLGNEGRYWLTHLICINYSTRIPA